MFVTVCMCWFVFFGCPPALSEVNRVSGEFVIRDTLSVFGFAYFLIVFFYLRVFFSRFWGGIGSAHTHTGRRVQRSMSRQYIRRKGQLQGEQYTTRKLQNVEWWFAPSLTSLLLSCPRTCWMWRSLPLAPSRIHCGYWSECVCVCVFMYLPLAMPVIVVVPIDAEVELLGFYLFTCLFVCFVFFFDAK